MSQMGGAAVLDYGAKFSSQPWKHINIGYNSLLSSWALMNTGNNGQGYWYPDKQNDGAVGWMFCPWQHGNTYFDFLPAKRGASRVSGEIDHGLVGGVHAAATYVVDDPLFGMVCYGGDFKQDKDKYTIISKDGVRRKLVFIQNKLKFKIEFEQDGLLSGSEVMISKDFQTIRLTVENRNGQPHECSFLFSGLKGNYRIFVDGVESGQTTIFDEKVPLHARFLLEENHSEIKIIKI